MALSSLAATVVQDLEQHREILRIKKLLFFACKRRWENDTNVLNSHPLGELIEELLRLNSTLEELTATMYRVVDILNRKDVYAEIANIIISKLTALYDDTEEDTQMVLVQKQKLTAPIFSDDLIDEIAEHLDSNKEAVRIKKLLFATCKQYWENDPNTINQYSFSDLIAEARQLYLELDHIQAEINRIVGTLNRQSVYSFVANIIIYEITPLYENQSEVLGGESEFLKQLSFPQQQPEPQPESQPSSINYNIRDQGYSWLDDYERENQELELQQANLNNLESEEVDVLEDSISRNREAGYDPFKVRFELMKYTNPLRAKILLFSLVYHQFDYSSQDWSVLRTCHLDDLMLKVFVSHNNPNLLETKLINIVKLLPQSDEHLQAAGIIMQSLRPLYV